MNKLKVLVTGSNGFLGSHIVYHLSLRGHHVFASHRASSNLWRLNHMQSNIELVEMDLLDAQSIRNAFETNQPDAVIHCAAYGVKYEEQDQSKAFTTNVEGTSNLICAAKKVDISRFIHIGSCFEYGDKSHPIHEDEVVEPTNIYGVSKASATLLALALSRQKKFSLVVLRPFGLWGPLEETYRLVPQVVSHCLAKKPLKLTGCKQIRDYTFVEDTASMLIDLLELSEFPSHEVFNLSSGIQLTLKEFVLSIASLFNQNNLMLFDELPYRPTEMWQLVANIDKWRKYVGEIKQTSISQGVQKMLQYEDVKKEAD